MTKEDYKTLATLIRMYCMPDLCSSVLLIPNATPEQVVEQKLANEKIKAYYKGQKDMYHRIIKFVDEKWERDELQLEIFNQLMKRDKS